MKLQTLCTEQKFIEVEFEKDYLKTTIFQVFVKLL